MENKIVVSIKPIEIKQYIYIFSDITETMPITVETTMNELLSIIAMSAAKYKIKNIKLSGPKSYSLGVKDQLIEKINTCFGKSDDFIIELM